MGNIAVILSVTLMLIVALVIISTRQDEGFANYTKCSKYPVRGIVRDIFREHDVQHTESGDWDLFYPCTYTHVEHELRHLQCRTRQQKIYAIDGCDSIVAKNALWQLLEDAYGRRVASSIMPTTYILSNAAHMRLFLQDYRRNTLYILKKNVQRKEGLLLTSNLDAILKSHIEGYKVIQKYLLNVHLVDQRKLNLRVYVLLVCDPFGQKRAYLHRDGKCLYTNKKYDARATDLQHQITSFELSPDIYRRLPLNFADLRRHWHLRGIEFDRVYASIVAKMQNVVRAALPHVCVNRHLSQNTRFQLFGADVILTDKLEPYILEFNKGPEMQPINARDRQLKRRVLEDTFATVGLISPPKRRPSGYLLL